MGKIKGNKLIAEFAAEKREGMPKGLYYRPGLKISGFVIEDARYHSSWDWLMPVVEKMYSLKYTMIIDIWAGCEVYSFATGFTSSPIITVDRNENETIIECVYQSVIQFIQFYNTIK